MFKRITYVLALASVLQFTVAKAQQAEKERCSTEKYMQQQLAKNAKLQSAINKVDQEADKWLASQKQKDTNNKTNRPVITIPVVVHILYNETAPQDNLPMEQVLSQIEVLNQDYQFRNTDRNNIPPIFQSVAGNVDIEFCLASRKPNGEFTDGVTRTKLPADLITFTLDNDQIKKPELGGVAIWNRNEYLNIWVGRLEDDVLGYASSPGSTANIDGVAIGTRYFGKGNQFDLNSSYDRGRTTTHEVGHWLGLKHIWGSYTRDPKDFDDLRGCNFDDGIGDTPNSVAPYYDCPRLSDSFSCGSQDMTMNFMDYVNDACMYMFTKGQKERVLSVLNTDRKSLFNSKGCQNLSFNVDAGISVKSIEEKYCGNSYPLEVNVTNVGQNLIETLHIEYRVNNGDSFPYFKTLNLNPGEVETLSLANINIAGENNFEVVITLVNGTQDQNIENNDISFTVISTDIAQIPLTEGFEGGADRLERNGWRNDNIDEDDFKWEIEDQFGAPPTSNNSLLYDNFNGDSINNPRNTLDHFITPSFDLANATTVSFSFDRAYARYNKDFFDGLRLYYSIDCGNSWEQFWFKENTDLATFPFDFDGGTPFIPGAEDWEKETIELNQLAGETEVLFRITNISGWGQFLWLDNINITAMLTSATTPIIQKGITIYPNPTIDGLAKVDIPQKKQLFEQVSVYNMFGQIVFQQTIHPSNPSILLDLTDQPNGIYIVDALNKAGYHTVQRLVKSNFWFY